MKLYKSHLWKCIEEHGASSPDKACIITPQGHEISFGDLIHKVHRFTLSYLNQGINAESRVLLLIPPSTDFLLAFLALERIGATIVLADIAMGNAVFESRVEMAGVSHIVTTRTIRWILQSRSTSTLLRLMKIPVPHYAGSAVPIITSKKKVDTSIKTTEEAVDLQKEFLIIFTSGTTSEPKGVVHTYQSMSDNFQRMMQLLQDRNTKVICSNQPYILFPALAIGGTVLLPRRIDKPKKLFKIIVAHHVDTIFMLPTDLKSFAHFMERTSNTFPQSLRNIAVGSAPVYSSFLQKIQSVLPASVSVWCIYGLTEILPVSIVEMREKILWQEPGDLLGKPLEGINASISNDGELLLQGHGLFNRYLGKDTKCMELATGDLCRIVNGNIVLLGRKKDMIIRREYNIYPALYEPEIAQISGIQDCALIGIYNSSKEDEEIVLVIVPERGKNKDQLVKYIERELTAGVHAIDAQAMPDRIEFLEELPVSGRSKKIDKKALRSHFSLSR